jgi:chromosome segregation ATPase
MDSNFPIHDMAEKKATDERVFAEADALLAEGQKPTVPKIRERTGGSYTTVQEALKRWEEARAAAQKNPPPPELADKADAFLQVLWNLATQKADAATEAARVSANQAISAAQAELAYAQAEIRRLEQERNLVAERLSDSARERDRERHALDQRELRVQQLEGELRLSTEAYSAVRDQVQQHAVRAAALEGECASLKEQLSAFIASMRTGRPSQVRTRG